MSFQKLATYFKSWIENVRRICCRILYVMLSSGGKKKNANASEKNTKCSKMET